MTEQTNELPSIWLMGPTASGKTDLAIALAKRFPCEIISVDSALIYKGMDIGTAKPSAKELAQAPHALVDFLDPAESYSVAQFRKAALKLMSEITARGRIPLLVGGTMMYYRALEFGLSDLPASTQEVRNKIQAQADEVGWAVLHQKLKKIDSVAAARIHVNDPQRLARALEVYEMTGQTLTHLQQTQKQTTKLPYTLYKYAIAPKTREELRERIAIRFDAMLDAGFEEEVRTLKMRDDLHLDLPSMRCVGYRQMWQYLAGEVDYITMREKGITATRQLAKRQMTWLRSEQGVNWLETDNLVQRDEIFATLCNVLNLHKNNN